MTGAVPAPHARTNTAEAAEATPDSGFPPLVSLRYGDPLDDVLHHRVRGEAVAGGVRAQPDAVVEHVDREILDVLGVDLVPAADQQGPDLGEPAPGDDGAR